MNTHCSSKGRFNYEFLFVHLLSAAWAPFKLTLRAQFAAGWSIVKFGHAEAWSYSRGGQYGYGAPGA